MKIHMLAGAALLLGSSIAIAQEADPEEAPGESPAEAIVNAAGAEAVQEPAEEELDPGEEVVCRSERVTGSLSRRRRTCMTRNEWNDVEARTRDALNATNRSASGGQCVPQGQTGVC